MSSFVAHLRYARYVLRHKWFVYREGRKLGLGRRRLIRHDMSKFSRAEWGPYVAKFYSGKASPEIDAALQKAWRHHYRHNAHHWDYWVKTYDEWSGELPEPIAQPMPLEDRLEMVADLKAMGYANKGYDDTREFYQRSGASMNLHPETRMWLEQALQVQ